MLNIKNFCNKHRFAMGIVAFVIAAIVGICGVSKAVAAVQDATLAELKEYTQATLPVVENGYQITKVSDAEQEDPAILSNPLDCVEEIADISEGTQVVIAPTENNKTDYGSYVSFNATIRDRSVVLNSNVSNEVVKWECHPMSRECYTHEDPPGSDNYDRFILVAFTSLGNAVGEAQCQDPGLVEPGAYDILGHGGPGLWPVPGDSGGDCTVTFLGWYDNLYHWSVTNEGHKTTANYQRWVGEFTAPGYGGMKMQKKSTCDWSESNPNYSLENTVYYVYDNDSDAWAYRNPLASITLNKDGYGETGQIFNHGRTYTVRESNKDGEHGTNYLANETDIGHVYIEHEEVRWVNWQDSGTTITYDTPIDDPAPVAVRKADAQTKEAGIPEGDAKLEDAHYDYQYYTDYFTLKSEIEAHSASYQRHWVMATDKNGETGVAEDYKEQKVAGDDFYYKPYDKDKSFIVCPLGTYVVHEVKAPDGYLLSEKFYIVQVVKSPTGEWGLSIVYDADTGEQISYIEEENYFKGFEQVKKGDYKFVKVDADNHELSGIPFKITSQTTGEWHIVVTDANGIVDTSAKNIPHTQKTNANDANYNPTTGKIIDESKLIDDAGCWFAIDTETGKVAEPVDSIGALPYDTYTVEELEISKNTIYYPFGTKSFVVSKDEYEIDGGTWVNSKNLCITESRGIDGTQELYATERETAIDRVYYEGLLEGWEYEIKAWLVARDDEQVVPLLDGYNKENYIRSTFIANSSVGYTDIKTDIDTRAYSGKNIVWYVELYDVGLTRLIIDHKDVVDKRETLSIIQPLITTDLIDVNNGGHSLEKRADGALEDTVVYEKVKVGHTYNVYGVLYDKATKKPYLNEVTGQIVETKGSFVPIVANGKTTIRYEFDSTLVPAGKELVSFVEIRVGDVVISEHKLLDDERETVVAPETAITTNAFYSDGNKYFIAQKDSSAYDVISYKGLPSNKQVDVYSWFVYADSGLPVTDGELDGVAALDACDVIVDALGGRTTQVNEGEEFIEQWLVKFFRLPKTIKQERLAEVDYEALSHVIFSKQQLATSGTSGDLVVKYDFDASRTAAGKIVAYSMVCVDGVTLAANTDLNDENETLEILRSFIETSLTTDSGSKVLEPGQRAMLIDKVNYYTVIPNKKYKLEGQLVDKLTGQVLANNTVSFKPEEQEGSVELGLEVDTTGLDGHDLVAFERLYLDGTLACEHCDINDAEQTVHVNGIAPAAQTGDVLLIVNILALLVLAAACAAELVKRKRAQGLVGKHIC